MTFSLGGPYDPEKSQSGLRRLPLEADEDGLQSGGAMHAAGMPISHERLKTLAGAIEAGVIPRLLMAHRGSVDGAVVAEVEPAQPSYTVTALDVDAFTRLVLDGTAERAAESLEDFYRKGVSLEGLYLDLLTPVARRLGHLWDEDLVDFTSVTTGMGRLSYLIRLLSSDSQALSNMSDARRVLLTTPPDEQHSFGLFMVSEFMRLAGWNVLSEPAMSRRDLVDGVRDDPYVLVGFSLGSDRSIDWLTSTIAAIRRASCNKTICIMVGGPAFLSDPDLVNRIGADVTARDGREAVALAERSIRAAAQAGK